MPVLWPTGGHAVCLDMKWFLPHIPRGELSGMASSAQLHLESGERSVEIRTLLNGRDLRTGKNGPAKLELVRLTIPRRGYTRIHMDYVVWAVKKVRGMPDGIKGFVLVDEPPVLRHFTAKFKWVDRSYEVP